MAGRMTRKGQETTLSKALKPNSDVQRQDARRGTLKKDFGPSVDVYMSETTKNRLDKLIEKGVFPGEDVSPGTRGRCYALAELINQFYYDAFVRPKTKAGKEIADLYNVIWEKRIVDRCSEDEVANYLNEEGYHYPEIKKDDVVLRNITWSAVDVIKMTHTEDVIYLIRAARDEK